MSFPFAIGDIILTSAYHAVRKFAAILFISAAVQLFVIRGVPALASSWILMAFGLQFVFNNLEVIPTTPITEIVSAEKLRPRIPDLRYVVVINNSRNKIFRSNLVQHKVECWLPDQALFNSDCKIQPSAIPEAIDLVSHELK